MIVACHCEGTGWKFWADGNLNSEFWGRSTQLDPVGTLTLEFDDGDVFQRNKVIFKLSLPVTFWAAVCEQAPYPCRWQHPCTISYWESFSAIIMEQCVCMETMSTHASWNSRNSQSSTEICIRFSFWPFEKLDLDNVLILLVIIFVKLFENVCGIGIQFMIVGRFSVSSAPFCETAWFVFLLW